MSLNSNNIIPNAQDMFEEVPNNNKNKSGETQQNHLLPLLAPQIQVVLWI